MSLFEQRMIYKLGNPQNKKRFKELFSATWVTKPLHGRKRKCI
jgi:hypothetical protein